MELLSKTQKKKEALSLQAMGERLVTLSDEQLKDIGLPSVMFNAVTLAKKLKKHGARSRQMQYIGTLMRKFDPRPVQEALQRMEQGNREQSAEHRKIEIWRDELIAGNDLLIERFVLQFPLADRLELTVLVQKAREERALDAPAPRASRSLFRYLHRSVLQPRIPTDNPAS
jgi:ribosome-associated protein